ncbi:hypothetical protein SAY86_021211 [Trapa natans]|uniref:Uncharacterized protein n=1 Tax=Trapa natans TaxID=22666 RepID=A0AAN7M8A7_TRANT|nr:hypothetical protein SAY86_021211 [Trapa natans]
MASPKGKALDQSWKKAKKQRLSLPGGIETIEHPDKLKAENHLATSFFHQHREQRLYGDAGAFHRKALNYIWGSISTGRLC